MKMARPTLALLTVLLVGACVDRPEPDATGREIYLQVCARCHAADLSGGTGPPLGPESTSAELGDEFMHTAISRGRGRMPSFSQTLSPEQIDRVVDYLREAQGR